MNSFTKPSLFVGALCFAGLLQLGGCATWFRPAQAPLLRLSPADLGQDMSVFQRVVIEKQGQSKSFDAALEVDSTSMRLAVFQLGHTMARITWDGQQITQELTPGWPKVIATENILSDLQYVWWPAQAIQAALSTGWSLEDAMNHRVLRHGSHVVLEAKVMPPNKIELNNHASGYLVHIETEAQGPQPSFSLSP